VDAACLHYCSIANACRILRDGVQPVAEIHAVLYSKWTLLGMPIFALHRVKVLLSGAGAAAAACKRACALDLAPAAGDRPALGSWARLTRDMSRV